jgi:hypothetical protein
MGSATKQNKFVVPLSPRERFMEFSTLIVLGLDVREYAARHIGSCSSMAGCETGDARSMNEPIMVSRRPRIDIKYPPTLFKRVLQAERDQKADEDRIDAAIAQAEQSIAALRPITRKQLHEATTAVRDRAVLTICNVRKNMQRRTVEAKNIEETLSNDFLRQKCRFAEDEVEDAYLRTRFFKLIERTPTFTLIVHLRDAFEAGNIACAETIRFELQGRNDLPNYSTTYESILEKSASQDPVEMRKRLANICNAAEKVDARVTDLLQQAERLPQGFGFPASQESANLVIRELA